MLTENSYENFRTILTMNLCQVLNADQMNEVLKMVDISANDFEISRKKMEIITCEGTPDVVKYYIASKSIANLSYKTLCQYRYKLVNFFDTVKKSYQDLTPNDIRMYLHVYKVDHNASDRYMESIRGTINGFFQWLVDNDYLTKNPCAKIEKIHFQPKPRQPMSSYELEYFRWNTENIREKALIDFFFSTGCRVSECAGVKLSDIDWRERSVMIRKGKGGKSRIVYFNAESEVSLRKYLDTRKDNNDGLFVSVRAPHQAIGAHALENIIRKVGERTGLHVFPHKLRHTFATSGIRGGMPLEKLQQLMGHVNPRTTLIYAKLDQYDLKLEHQKVYQ